MRKVPPAVPPAAIPMTMPLAVARSRAVLKKIPMLGAMLVIIALLGGVGVLALYSAAGGDWSPWAARHAIRLVIGFALMVAVALVPIGYYRRYALLGWGLAVAALLVVEIIGTGSGVQRWISLGGFRLQPSEPAKLALIIVLAAWFNRLPVEMIATTHRHLPLIYAPAVLLVLVPVGLVLAQPDLGTAMMMLVITAMLVLVVGIPRWIIGTVLLLGLSAIPVIWANLYDYQKDRILVFLNPGADALGAGYQIIQSKIALGSGGIIGKGYLQGSQSRLNYLPEKQTDFIFTIIGEEFGFIGALVVITLYALLIVNMVRIGLGLNLHFSRLVVVGVGIMMFAYVFVNIGMVSGLLPVVGAPLPLISYGGTALMTVFIASGVIISAVLYDTPEPS